MDAALAEPLTLPEQDRLIAATVRQERGRLLAFIRRRIADAAEADDILQETLYELVAAPRPTQPIEQAGGGLLARGRARSWRPGMRPQNLQTFYRPQTRIRSRPRCAASCLRKSSARLPSCRA